MSFAVHRATQAIQDAIERKDFASAHAQLDIQLERTDINDYERAVLWQQSALVAFSEGDSVATIEAYQNILRYKESIPEQLELAIIFNLGQLYYTQNELNQAITMVHEWEARIQPELVTIQDQAFVARLHLLRGELDLAQTYIDKALQQAASYWTTEHEPLYQTWLLIAWERGDHEVATKIARDRLAESPAPYYCRILAGMKETDGMAHDQALAEARAEASICADMNDILLPATEMEPPVPAMRKDRVNKAKPDSDGNRPLMVVSYPTASYPKKASRKKISGEVAMTFDVLEDGRVDKGSIKLVSVEPKGYKFEKSAIEAAERLRYLPQLAGGAPQKVTGVTYTFTWSTED